MLVIIVFRIVAIMPGVKTRLQQPSCFPFGKHIAGRCKETEQGQKKADRTIPEAAHGTFNGKVLYQLPAKLPKSLPHTARLLSTDSRQGYAPHSTGSILYALAL
jgi:hypothetical protein